MIQFLFLAKQCNSVCDGSALCQFKKIVRYIDYSALNSGRVFLFLLLFFCKIFVMVVIKVLLHCCVADKWHSVCEKMCILFKILIVQLFC